jgi:tRNA pseudouridine38-40 synthase
MRYFLELSYHGARYAGWQVQPGAVSVQSTLQDALSLLLRKPVGLTGCGRTDAGVHARGYWAHFDHEQPLARDLLYRMNQILPSDIAVQRLLPVHGDAHARFDAIQRRYCYRISQDKDPFLRDRAWQWPFADPPDLERLNSAAALLLQYREFAPFCKSNTDAQTRLCDLRESFWIPAARGRELVYWVTADRFLRGMIRLIVGMCVRVAAGKTDLEEVREALDRQTLLHGSWLVPPEGLTLTEVRYPYIPR